MHNDYEYIERINNNNVFINNMEVLKYTLYCILVLILMGFIMYYYTIILNKL
jgi:hypothetical protein